MVQQLDNLNGYLKGKALLAMPNMGDPRFHHAVIYICTHDAKGAMGFVINDVLPGMVFENLLEELEIKDEVQAKASILKTPIFRGGPVEMGRGFLLHSKDFEDKETSHVTEDLAITGTIEALKAVAEGKGPREKLIMFGHAGWEAGQLDSELQQNSWLVADANADFIFNIPHADKWAVALKSIGVNPAQLSGAAGQA